MPRRIIGIFLFFCKKINAAKGFSTSFRIYFKTLRSCSFCPCWCILFLQFTHAFLEADLCSHKNLLPGMYEGSTTP